MGARGKDLLWRDRDAARLLLRHFPLQAGDGPVLVAGDPLPHVSHELDLRGVEVASWNRRAFGGQGAEPWPPEGGSYRAVALRLPRAKAELSMSLAAAASVLGPGGEIFVYGAKDEGVASAPGQMEGFFKDVGTLAVGGRCRVISGARVECLPEGTTSLRHWREVHPLAIPGLPEAWVSYPGVFAHGHVDHGTRLLLAALPSMPAGARVLDFGCGSGVVGGLVLSRNPGVEVHFLDVDSVALFAVRENVPQGTPLLRDGLPLEDGVTYGAIMTNPPFHQGKAEDPEMIRTLIRQSPRVLSPGGRLVLVAQMRLSLGDAFSAAFQRVSTLAEGSGFRVWEGRNPKASRAEETKVRP